MPADLVPPPVVTATRDCSKNESEDGSFFLDPFYASIGPDNHMLLLAAGALLKLGYDAFYSKEKWYLSVEELEKHRRRAFLLNELDTGSQQNEARIIHTIYGNSGVRLLDSSRSSLAAYFTRCWWSRCGGQSCVMDVFPGGISPPTRKEWIGYVVEKQRPDGAYDLYIVWRGILFKSEWVSTFCANRLVPYRARTWTGERCGFVRCMPRVHAGWKYIYTRSLPVKLQDFETFPDIQQHKQVAESVTIPQPEPVDNASPRRANLTRVPTKMERIHTRTPHGAPDFPAPAAPQEGIRNVIYDLMVQQHKQVKRVITFGHSLGGALSVLSAYDIAYYLQDVLKLPKEQLPQVGVVNFGAPKVGDIRFHNELEERNVQVVRVVNVRDLVPETPGCCELTCTGWVCMSPFACCSPPTLCDCNSTSLYSVWALKCVMAYACFWCWMDGIYYHSGTEVPVDTLKDAALAPYSNQEFGHRLNTYMWLLLAQHFHSLHTPLETQKKWAEGADNDHMWKGVLAEMQRYAQMRHSRSHVLLDIHMHHSRSASMSSIGRRMSNHGRSCSSITSHAIPSSPPTAISLTKDLEALADEHDVKVDDQVATGSSKHHHHTLPPHLAGPYSTNHDVDLEASEAAAQGEVHIPGDLLAACAASVERQREVELRVDGTVGSTDRAEVEAGQVDGVMAVEQVAAELQAVQANGSGRRDAEGEVGTRKGKDAAPKGGGDG